MKTVCAASVLFGREAFSPLGEVVVLPDRRIGPADLADADALAIRSKTRVDAALVAGSRLQFVGTATAGFDHIDAEAMAAGGIFWCASPGCNAPSVAEYIASALLCLSSRHGIALDGLRIAVIGVGQVGRRVVAKTRALGMIPLQNDPPRALEEGPEGFLPLEEALAQADVVTLHVPLTDDGPFATRGMVDCRFLERMKPGAVFLNASRGEVVDEAALKLALDGGQVSHAVLDVWNREPDCDPDLMARVDLATPHIAGYSWDGKLSGTVMVHRAMCSFFEVEPSWDPASVTPPPETPELVLEAAGRSDEEALWTVVRRLYDITRDDADLRAEVADETIGARFERLRKKYWTRREFDHTRVVAGPADRRLALKLAGLGFRID